MIKNKRVTVMVMLFLACIAMISIGFATWTISLNKPTNEEIDGTIDTDDVINSDDYVTMEIDNSRMFRYCKYGFVSATDGATIVSKGVLPLNITLHNLNDFKNKFNKDNFDSIVLVITLKYDNSKVNGNNAFKLFTDSESYKFTQEIIEDKNEPYQIDKTSGKVTTSFKSNECIITLKLDNLIKNTKDTYNFSIDYGFNVLVNDLLETTQNEMYDYFKNNIYNTIHRKNLFSLTCKISGYKVGAGEQ